MPVRHARIGSVRSGPHSDKTPFVGSYVGRYRSIRTVDLTASCSVSSSIARDWESRKSGAPRRSRVASQIEESTSSGHIPGPYDEISQTRVEMPPPRAVRMSFRGKFTAIMIPAILLLLAGLTSGDYFHPTADWQKQAFVSFFRFTSALAIVLGLFQWRVYARHKRLVSDGEVALGRITKNYGSARNGQYVRYEFQTQSGDRLSRIRTSWKNLDVGMRVPIFYDRQNTKKQVALFAAFYEAALPRDSRR